MVLLILLGVALVITGIILSFILPPLIPITAWMIIGGVVIIFLGFIVTALQLMIDFFWQNWYIIIPLLVVIAYVYYKWKFPSKNSIFSKIWKKK